MRTNGKKIAIQGAVFSLVGIIIVYLLFAFSLWNINPGEWHEYRKGMAFMSGSIVAMVTVISAIRWGESY